MIFVAALLLLAGAPEDALGKARKDYSACLSSFTSDAISKRMTADAFKSALRPKCAAKETAFRAALLTANTADGMKAAEAEADAEDQVAEYLEKFAGEFDDYLKG